MPGITSLNINRLQLFIQSRKQLNNRSTKHQRFHPIWSKKLTFSHITAYTRNSTQQTVPQRPIFTTDDPTHYQQKHTLKIAPVALHNHINNLFSGITKQLNNTYAITKNNQPLYGRLPKRPTSSPRLPDNQPNFHRQFETSIRAILTTRHYPNSEETPESLKPQRSL